MTDQARQVLADCHLALEMLEEEQDLRRWRVLWAGAVALTRSVGHVLDKVDGKACGVRVSARSAYRRWKTEPQHEIFREFIESERNNILKEYKFSHHPADEVVALLTLRHPLTGEVRHQPDILQIGENIYRPLLEGFREGDDARDVLSDALEWWRQEIDAIDEEVMRNDSPKA